MINKIIKKITLNYKKITQKKLYIEAITEVNLNLLFLTEYVYHIISSID